MNTEEILTLLYDITKETTDECRGIAEYVNGDKSLGYQQEDEIVFKAIMFNKLRQDFSGRFRNTTKGGGYSVTLELSISRNSFLPLKNQINDINLRRKIDIAISDDNPWRDLEKPEELILIEVKNPTGRNKNGVLTRQDEIGGSKGDMKRLNQIKTLLPTKITTVMIVAYIGNIGSLNEVKIKETKLRNAESVDHLWIF